MRRESAATPKSNQLSRVVRYRQNEQRKDATPKARKNSGSVEVYDLEEVTPATPADDQSYDALLDCYILNSGLPDSLCFDHYTKRIYLTDLVKYRQEKGKELLQKVTPRSLFEKGQSDNNGGKTNERLLWLSLDSAQKSPLRYYRLRSGTSYDPSKHIDDQNLNGLIEFHNLHPTSLRIQASRLANNMSLNMVNLTRYRQQCSPDELETATLLKLWDRGRIGQKARQAEIWNDLIMYQAIQGVRVDVNMARRNLAKGHVTYRAKKK